VYKKTEPPFFATSAQLKTTVSAHFTPFLFITVINKYLGIYRHHLLTVRTTVIDKVRRGDQGKCRRYIKGK
jgi:hypothetical protein